MIEIKKMGHAFLMAKHQGKVMLFDPWFGQPINFKTFFANPEIAQMTDKEMSEVIAIHISHIHDDHLQIDTLKKFPINTKILIAKYADKRLYEKIKNLGFENIQELEPGKKSHNFGPFNIDCYPKAFNDGSFDSSVMLTIDNKHFYIANDCIHADSQYYAISFMYPQIECAFVGYTSISAFSWCVDSTNCSQYVKSVSHDNKIEHRQVAVWKHIESLCKILQPKKIIPYSSDYSFAHKEHIFFNKYFDTADSIFKYNLSNSTPHILLNGSSIAIDEQNNFNILSNKITTKPLVQLDSWVDTYHEEIDFEKFIFAATQFFQDKIGQLSKNWQIPMSLSIHFHYNEFSKKIYFEFQNNNLSLVDHLSSVDLEISYPAKAFNGVLNKQYTLRQFHILFLFRAKWHNYIHNQMDLNFW